MRWTLPSGSHEQSVVISGSTWQRTVEWLVDGQIIATESTSDDRLTLSHEGDEFGAIGLRFPRWSADARRVTLYAPEPGGELDPRAAALLGQGGVNFVPEPGSAADKREARIRLHPVRHTLLLTAAGVLKVVVPILLGVIAVRFVVTLPLAFHLATRDPLAGLAPSLNPLARDPLALNPLALNRIA